MEKTINGVSNAALDANAITLDAEASNKFINETNAQVAIAEGIQDDKSKAEVYTNALAREDELVSLLLNNGIARASDIQMDPCKSGNAKFYVTTPYMLSTTDLSDDDGTGCCVGTPDVLACRSKAGLNLLCVKDCIGSVFEELMEEAVVQKQIDTWTPWKEVGRSLKAKRAAFVGAFAKYTFERNLILGTPSFAGEGLRPFNGLVSRLLDPRTLSMDGSAGFISAIRGIDCRAIAMGKEANYVIAINPIAEPTLRAEVAAEIRFNSSSEFSIDANGRISFRGRRIIRSRFIDVDLATNTTSIWMIDPSEVGIKTIFTPGNPQLRGPRYDTTQEDQDCGGSCIRLFMAGTTVVNNFMGLSIVNNLPLSSVCDASVLTGLEGFVNSTTLYPAPTANAA